MTSPPRALTPPEVDEALRIRRIAFSHWEAFALQEACQHGVFTALSHAPATAPDLAARLGLDPRATQALLEVLTGLSLLTTAPDGGYRNTETAQRFLVASSPFNQADIIRHYRDVIDIDKMRQAFTRGYQPPATPTNAFVSERPATLSAEQRDTAEAMHATASVLAPALIARVDARGATRLLDVGGGCGSYAIFLALAHPELHAVVLDGGPMVVAAEEMAARYGVADRINTRVADFHGDDYGRDFDLVLFSNVMHVNAPDECRAMLASAWRALRPGGRVYVHEPLRSGHGDGPLFAALFSLSLLTRTVHGDTYCRTDIEQWLAQAGFIDVVAADQHPLPSTIVSARRPHGA